MKCKLFKYLWNTEYETYLENQLRYLMLWLTLDSSSMCSMKMSSPGRRIHDNVRAVTNCSDNMGGSGCDGAATAVVYMTGTL